MYPRLTFRHTRGETVICSERAVPNMVLRSSFKNTLQSCVQYKKKYQTEKKIKTHTLFTKKKIQFLQPITKV